MHFEKDVIKKLADEHTKLSGHLLDISDNIKDLMAPFQKKLYVTPSMMGSYSIKFVLPALVSDMKEAYTRLEGVQNGTEAVSIFATLSKLDIDEKQKMQKALLEYCKLDTLAMVKILGELKKVVDD